MLVAHCEHEAAPAAAKVPAAQSVQTAPACEKPAEQVQVFEAADQVAALSAQAHELLQACAAPAGHAVHTPGALW